MLSLNDLKEKKLLFISAQHDLPNDLKFSRSNICLYKYGKCVNKISLHIIISIFIIGNITLTNVLIKKAIRNGISIFLLNNSLGVDAEIMSKAAGNYKLRQIQYFMSNNHALEISKNIVLNKINNQALILKKARRTVLDTAEFTLKILASKNLSSLRGFEGNYAKTYFKRIFSTIGWHRRAPRTKEDIPNLLLDIGYTFMFNYVDSILKLFGFDTYKGVYHQLFFQRKSLASDFMEVMRPLVDYQLVKSYNLKQVNEKDFQFKNGAFAIKSFPLRKKYADIWMQLIMTNREAIYMYILSYYRYLFNPLKYPFPIFKI